MSRMASPWPSSTACRSQSSTSSSSATARRWWNTSIAPPRQEGAPCPLEASFRYPGPKPQSREAGIVMLADAVESASRTLPDPSPGSLRKLVRDLLMKRLLDGQFEESRLPLTELHLIEETLCKGLTGMHHSRIKYPDAR